MFENDPETQIQVQPINRFISPTVCEYNIETNCGIFYKRKIELLMGLCVILCAFVLARKGAVFVQSEQAKSAPVCIVVDAGHGGDDPGKIGINDALEKDINLQIALKLQKILEQNNIKVVMTRNTDAGLYSEGATNKKAEDMQKRCKIIEDSNALFTVSIHQNSYHEESIHGAQVFYYKTSKEMRIWRRFFKKSWCAWRNLRTTGRSRPMTLIIF